MTIRIPKSLTRVTQQQIAFAQTHRFLPILGIMLVPMDSSPLFPLSTNRPIWSLFFSLYFFLELCRKPQIKKQYLPLFAFLILFYTYSMGCYVFSGFPIGSFIKGFTVTSLAALSFMGMVKFFEEIIEEHGLSELPAKVSELIIYSSFVPMSVGLMQVASGFGLFPMTVARGITSIFSYRVGLFGRMQMISGEPSWAANYLIFVFVVTFLFYKGPSKKLLLWIYVIFLILTKSTLGILFFLTLVGGYIFLNLNVRKLFRVVAILILAALAFNYLILPNLGEYVQHKFNSIAFILSNLSVEAAIMVASRDNSFLARMVNPIIGFYYGFIHAPIGHGLETFHHYVKDGYLELGVLDRKGVEERGGLLKWAATPKALLSRVIFEGGVFYLLFFLTFYLKEMWANRYNRNMVFLLASLPIITISEDSYLFYGVIISMALAHFRPK